MDERARVVLAAQWHARRRARNSAAARVASIFGFTLVPLFSIVDYFTDPEHFSSFLYMRLGLAAYSLFVFTCARREFFVRHCTPFSVALVISVAATINWMTFAMDGFDSDYFAGTNLVMLASGLLFLWRLPTILFTYGVIVLSYVIPNLGTAGSVDLEPIVQHVFFVVSTGVVVSMGQVFAYRFQRRQFMTERSLARARDDIQAANEQLRELDRFRARVFANITHELKTPLALILSPLELMLDGDLGRVNDQQRRSMESMFRSGLRLMRMIGDILDLSRLDESRVRLRVAEHDLVAYLRGLAGQVEPLFRRKRIRLSFSTDRDECLSWYDQERLERVFVNLLSNAAKFTPEGGEVVVRVEDLGDDIRVSVEDSGPGIPEDKLEAVFDRFFQVDMESSRKHGGSGIGLSLARELVELHGGTIEARNVEAGGAAFVTVLPRDRDHFDPNVLDRRTRQRPVGERRRESDVGAVDWSRQLASRDEYRLLEIADVTDRRVVERDPDEDHRRFTVLVVEDTPDVIRLVHLSLRQHFKVLAATDGLSGLEMALRHKPSLVVTDLMMPGIDGLELTRRLREEPRTKHLPIIMLTARGDLEDRLEGLEQGASAYIAKPFSPRELLTTARGLLDIQETTADLVLTQRMDSLETVATGLAHEINNPLNYIKVGVDFMRTQFPELQRLTAVSAGGSAAPREQEQLAVLVDSFEKMFASAAAGVERIAGTVRLMRSYSRDGFQRNVREYDIYEAVREVVRVVHPSVARDVAVELDLQGDGLMECVPDEMNQVLGNLVQNALEAVDAESGCVAIRARQSDGYILLAVKDDGEGMAPDVCERIFTPFYTTKTAGRGMGMGLTIVWRVIKSLGGSVDVESRVGGGSEFRLHLPVVQSVRR